MGRTTLPNDAGEGAGRGRPTPRGLQLLLMCVVCKPKKELHRHERAAARARRGQSGSDFEGLLPGAWRGLESTVPARILPAVVRL